MSESSGSETTTSPSSGVGIGYAALAGIVSALAALGVGELVGAFGSPSPGPVIAVANLVIDHAPTWFVNFGKNLFGLADKPALIVGTVLISAVLAAGLAVAARRRFSIAAVGFGGFGLLGAVAVGTDPQGSWIWAVLSATAAVVAGLGTLKVLLARAEPAPSSTARPVMEAPTHPMVSRRAFFGWAGAAGLAAVAAGAGARSLRNSSSVNRARNSVELAGADSGQAIEQTIKTASESRVATTPGISSLVTPNENFYLIDTALIRPSVNPDDWALTITGMVDNELTITYPELVERAKTVVPVTLSCVSNRVGGDLVGNAVWQGVPLTELLDEAGVQSGATQIASRSVDGWTCGFPTEAAYDGRNALVAVAMNGEPLPVAHGFPARLVVAGLYGYVSATKWLKNIELTTWEDFDGYWVPRGWSKLGPIKTQSRIDTPRRGETLSPGTVAVAGVAWAPNTGIAAVEVQVDEGDWVQAELGERLTSDTWIQWFLPWEATAGRHTLRVRATDESGYTQTSDLAEPAPNGATGWHSVVVNVEAQ